MTTKKIRVLIVDDSALIRGVLKKIISEQPDMEVVGVAPDPSIARTMINQLKPDVLTLDVEMPKMDGLDFLERIMRLKPMRVLMISTMTQRGSDIALRALEIGAVDYIAKPTTAIQSGMLEYSNLITEKIRAVSMARLKTAPVPGQVSSVPTPLPTVGNLLTSSEKLIIIGASTGGTEAIKEFLMQMPSDCPGILITQHMPAGFTTSFAARLNSLCKITVQEAAGNERIMPGHAYIAPGSYKHLTLMRSGANYMTHLEESPPVNRHCPSVDVLFHSAAKFAGKNAIGVILTGMGADGAQGMLAMREAGAYNFAQDEASCVVYGMPKEAVRAGGVHESGALKDLPAMVLRHLAANAGRMLRV